MAQTVAEFEAAAGSDPATLRTLLTRILKTGAVDSDAALIDLFSRGIHVQHNEDLWAEILAQVADPSMAGVLQGALENSVRSEQWTTANSGSLWSLLLSRLGDAGPRYATEVLREWGLPGASATRHAVLSALPEGLTDDAVPIVAEELRTPTNALPAGKALLRSGRVDAVDAVVDHLRTATDAQNAGTVYLALASEVGKVASERQMAKLRDSYSREHPFAAAVYLRAVGSMEPERMRRVADELPRFVRTALEDAASLSNLEGMFIRREIATVVESAAKWLASSGLHEALLREADARPNEGLLRDAAEALHGQLEKDGAAK